MQRVFHGIVALAAVLGLAGVAWGQTTGAATQPAPASGTTAFHATHHSVHHLRRRHRQAHAVPPAQPRGQAPVPAGLVPAPVPDENVGPPAADNAGTPGPSVHPGDLQMHYPPSGEGFLPGSSHTAMDNLNTPKAPGVTVQVPVGITQAPPAPPP